MVPDGAGKQSERLLLPAYNSAVLLTALATVNTRLPVVPGKTVESDISLLVRLTSPPACRLPLAFIAQSRCCFSTVVLPLPAVSWPLLVSLPAAFSVIPLPCNVAPLVISPGLLTESCLFAAITPLCCQTTGELQRQVTECNQLACAAERDHISKHITAAENLPAGVVQAVPLLSGPDYPAACRCWRWSAC